MKYELHGHGQHLVHILRYLMAIDCTGVLDREWKFSSALAWVHIGHVDAQGKFDYLEEEFIFPEHELHVASGFQTPFIVSGKRLVERSGLVLEFEDSDVVRLVRDSCDAYDLRIRTETGANVRLDLECEKEYLALKDRFDASAGARHSKCFC